MSNDLEEVTRENAISQKVKNDEDTKNDEKEIL